MVDSIIPWFDPLHTGENRPIENTFLLLLLLGGKCELSIHEPLNKATNVWHPVEPPEVAHHHIEISDRWQTVIVAHPHYLKVRVLGRNGRYRYDWETFYPVALGPEILQDLAALYSQV